MTAGAALPNLYFAAGKYFLHFYIFQESTVALLVTLLDSTDSTEFGSQSSEAFLLGLFGHSLVHICPFKVLTLGSGTEVLCCGADITGILQLLKP